MFVAVFGDIVNIGVIWICICVDVMLRWDFCDKFIIISCNQLMEK